MDSFSIWHWLIVVAIVLIFALAGNVVASNNKSLVVKKFFVNPEPRDDGVYV